MKLKLTASSKLIQGGNKQTWKEQILRSLERTPHLGPDYLIQLQELMTESNKWTREELAGLKMYCYSQGSWELRPGSSSAEVVFAKFDKYACEEET